MKHTILNNKYLLFTLRFFIGFIFIYSGIEKISNPAQFSEAILNYKLFNVFISNLIAISLPWFELLIGVLLIFGVNIKENSALISFLLIAFNLLIVIAIIRGLNIDCGCFGSDRGVKVGIIKLAENFGLLLLSLYIVYFSKDNQNNCKIL